MQKRRTLRAPLSLAVLAVSGILLGGCGDDDGGGFFDLSDPDVNQLPSCNVVAASVDLATQEIVVDVEIQDPDQLAMNIGMEVTLEIITSAGTFGNDVLSSTTGNLIIGNTVFGVAYSNLAPGALTSFRISSTTPDLLPSDPAASVRVTVVDELGGTSTCTGGVDLSLLLSEPTCNITAPGAADVGMGTITVSLDISDAQGDLSQISVYWSPDGGATLNPATLTGTTAGILGGAANACDPGNPYTGGTVTDIPTTLGGAPTALSVDWDSLADGAGAAAQETVTIVIFSEDCSTVAIGGSFNAACTTDTMVLNNMAPACTIQAPAAGSTQAGTGDVAVDYTTMDADSASVDSSFSWSSDGGTTWNTATAGAGSTNPQSAAPGAGTFNWDVPADLAAGSLPLDVIIRVQVDDIGRMTLPECTVMVTLVPISEPTCTWTGPAAGACVDAFMAGGIVSLDFNLADAQGDPISFSVCVNGAPATLTSTSNGALGAYAATNPAACAGASNQVTGAAAGATTVTWDIVADGLGGMACDAVTIEVFPEDGTTAGAGPFSTCGESFSVSNNGAPSCTVTAFGDTMVTYDVVDGDSAMVTASYEFSVDGGATFTAATPGGASMNPEMVAPGVGLVFTWDGVTDVPVCTVGVIFRVTVDDGVALANRPATCDSAPTDINCVPIMSACRVTDVVGAGTAGPTGSIPAYLGGGTTADISGENPFAALYWDFDYAGLNTGTFNATVQLTDNTGANVGNPAILYSAGHDYSALMDGGMCNMVDTFQLVLEGTVSGVPMDFAAAATPFMTATVNATWTSSNPGAVTVDANGLLTAAGENQCSTIDWTLTSSDPAVITIDPTCAAGSIVACVDSAGVDTTTRMTWLPIGDIDGNIPGLPSGPAAPGVGASVGITYIVNTDMSGVGAYAAGTTFNEAVLDNDSTIDTLSIGGSSQAALGGPFAVNDTVAGAVRWNDVDAFGSASGIFDLSTGNFVGTGSGTTTVAYQNEELADATACNIWVTNPCMPFNSFVCPAPPPVGGYQTIAATGDVTVP